MTINYKQCPKCGSKNLIKIIYGMPVPELFQEAEAGRIKLGGCCIFEGNPDYFCKDCENEWNRVQAIDSAYRKIKTIKASVGGYFRGYYNIEIDLLNLKITWSHYGNGVEEETVHKNIRKATAKNYIEELKIIDILNWKTKYIELGVCDGTQWSIEIIADERTIKKQGDNKFPEEWEMFCKLVREITNKKFR